MTAPASPTPSAPAPSAPAFPAPPASPLPTRGPSFAIFFAAFAVYLTVGVYLAVDQQFLFGDTLSRVQAAQSVLYSRDPHLSAIGFIFTPLTAVVQLPLIALSPWIPALTADALAAVITSALFMAGSVVMLAGIARDRGAPLPLAVIVVLAYAANPMIVLYGANGMSEAPALFFILWATRRLLRWVDTDDVHDLIVVGLALALGFLTRYDVGAAAVAAALTVAVISWRRPVEDAEPVGDDRHHRAVIDGAIVALPTLAAFLMWSVTSWIISGELLAQFTSEYGNAAIIEQSGGSGSDSVAEALRFSFTELLILAPALPVLLAVVTAVRWRRRRRIVLVAAVVVGAAVLAFQIVVYARGTTFGFLRFYLAVIPVAAAAALLACSAQRRVPWRRLGHHPQLPRPHEFGRRRSIGMIAGAAVAALSMVLAVPVTARGMTSPRYAPQEFALATIVHPQPDSVDQVYLDARKVARSFSTEKALAQYLDSLDLPEGSILTDTVYGFAVVTRSTNPRRFVIPSDQDFAEILNDPAAFGVQYLLSVPNEGRGRSDALNLRYPTLYANGASVATLTLEAPNQGADLPDWRVYRVVPSADGQP